MKYNEPNNNTYIYFPHHFQNNNMNMLEKNKLIDI